MNFILFFDLGVVIKNVVFLQDKSVNFKFPDIFKGDRDARQEKELKNMDEIKSHHRKQADRNMHRPGLPGWFSL
jgi:hypothetical protein